ncbi:ABC-type glycerol-3-phosphate transport system permease component [Actinoplanes lutulentus]|uniref:Carbohydrate ABC transporter membrane protein 2 (CUT1 family) n=2 Tax=Actinoplanes lutulentus TaxID=1287878 RepID=A0A327ZCB7_9ACTN|nr:ABC-type glycerol-3-phosphate transport system permease component [Actinoplanes lutulentus]RAK36595.1 carbohydrate ABC transporter membrane protein 2 (CUT1 family) [Actinoplanes lutulentus]
MTTMLTRQPAAPTENGAGGSARSREKRQRQSAFVYIAIVVCLALFGAPFLWILLTALATPQQLGEGAGGLLRFDNLQWNNFVEAVTRVELGAYFGNSLFLATLTAVLTTASSAIVGFAFARIRARGSKALFTIVLATMMIPQIATLIPTYMMFSQVGLVGTYWPWVLWGLSGSAYMIFLFRQFFAAIPLELEDAAIIDGCGWFRTFVQIFLPLSRPIILTSLLLQFTWAWGDYLTPALLLNQDNTTLAVAVTNAYLDPQGNGITTLQAAGSILYILPALVIFLFFQRYFISSALSSGVKG